jgi:hypothetical protein
MYAFPIALSDLENLSVIPASSRFGLARTNAAQNEKQEQS